MNNSLTSSTEYKRLKKSKKKWASMLHCLVAEKARENTFSKPYNLPPSPPEVPKSC
jgi:hypothetical protein